MRGQRFCDSGPGKDREHSPDNVPGRKACFFAEFFVSVTLVPHALGLEGGLEKLLFSRKNFQIQVGILSSTLEHGVPEQMFNTDPAVPMQSISAVKALQMASAEGQRIYHITPANQAQALPNLRLDHLAMTEISNALASGKEVIAHTDRISVPGFTGEGYMLIDPVTGAGAYKITGGGNGSFIVGLILGFMFAVSLFAGVISLLGLGLVPLLLAAITIASVAYILNEVFLSSHQACLIWGFMIGMGLFFFLLTGKPLIISVGMFVMFQSITAGLGASPVKWKIPPELSGCLAKP